MNLLCEKIHQYYETNTGGGALHIVLDDGNCEDEHIWWCVENSIPEDQDVDALEIAVMLLRLSVDERYRLYEPGWQDVPVVTEE
jgi:hypothetical protein